MRPDIVDIVAFDGDMLVLVDVKNRKAAYRATKRTSSPSARRRVAKRAQAYLDYADLESTAWRYDEVDLLVIADDRALLRHHRDVMRAES